MPMTRSISTDRLPKRALRSLVMAFALILGLTFSTGCIQSPTGPGLLFMNVKGPLGPAGGTDTPRRGKACARAVLLLFAWGDASIEAAKRDAGITQVTTIDHESFNFIGFGSFCTVVYGS